MQTSEASDRIRHYPCESCGADLAVRPGASSLGCAYCGFERALVLDEEEGSEIWERDLEAMLESQVASRNEEGTPTPDELEVRCPSCHARVTFRGTLTAQCCAYCGGPIQRADVHQAPERIRVDALLPFRIDREPARDAVEGWLRSLWFAPNAFTSKDAPERSQSVYVPFWTFDAMTATRYRGRTKKTKQKFWRKRKGAFQRFFDDVMVVADESLREQRMRGLGPWPLDDVIAYRPESLVGHLARTYDVELADGWKRARQLIEADLEREVRDRIGGDAQRIDEMETRWDALSYKHLLAPVYLTSLRHNERVLRVIVNGATGKVVGERPYSLVKIGLAAAAACVAIRVAMIFL